MALERRGGGVYYYTSRRAGGRVVKEYGGAGRVAELASQLDAADRELRRLDALGPRIEADCLLAETAAQRDWLKAVDGLVATALERSGWHHVRRQWRRKRGEMMAGLRSVSDLPWVSADLVAAAGGLDPDTEAKAKKGDAAALAAVDAFLAHPAAKAYWGDIGRHVLNTWADKYAGANPVMKRALLRFASDLRAGLSGPNPSALDTLLAERVVLAWLFVNWCEYQYAAQLADLSWKASECHTRRIEMAHRKLMSACRTLAKVRRAALPDVLALVSVSPPGTGK